MHLARSEHGQPELAAVGRPQRRLRGGGALRRRDATERRGAGPLAIDAAADRHPCVATPDPRFVFYCFSTEFQSCFPVSSPTRVLQVLLHFLRLCSSWISVQKQVPTNNKYEHGEFSILRNLSTDFFIQFDKKRNYILSRCAFKLYWSLNDT